ncbi:MAG: TonB-dependent receptor [Candidatus Omnitrophota bacterium]
MEEIEKIEVLKGPAAVHWGSGAISGMINITTKKPEDIQGTYVKATVGEYATKRGTIMHAGETGNLNYSIAAAYRKNTRWADEDDPDMSKFTLSTKLIYRLDEESLLSLDLRRADERNCLATGSFMTGTPTTDPLGAMFRMMRQLMPYLGMAFDIKNSVYAFKYENPDGWVRGYFGEHLKWTGPEEKVKVDWTYELEANNTSYLGKHTVNYGVYARKTTADHAILLGAPDVDIGAVYADDLYKLTPNLNLSLAGRLSHHSEIDWSFSGRTGVIYTPVEDHILRFIITQGFRHPSMWNLYINSESWGGIVPGEIGNRDLKAENILSFELAYAGLFGSRLKANCSLFHNTYDNLIYQTPTAATLYNGALRTSYYNEDTEQKVVGAELGFDYLFTDWLSGFANYTHRTLEHGTMGDLDDWFIPENTFNMGFKATLAGAFSIDIYGHWEGKKIWYTDEIDPIILVNARVAYMRDDVEMAISGYNIFNDEFQNGYMAEKIGSKITTSVSCKF